MLEKRCVNLIFSPVPRVPGSGVHPLTVEPEVSPEFKKLG
jgi:hypothetical protein